MRLQQQQGPGVQSAPGVPIPKTSRLTRDLAHREKVHGGRALSGSKVPSADYSLITKGEALLRKAWGPLVPDASHASDTASAPPGLPLPTCPSGPCQCTAGYPGQRRRPNRRVSEPPGRSKPPKRARQTQARRGQGSQLPRLDHCVTVTHHIPLLLEIQTEGLSREDPTD